MKTLKLAVSDSFYSATWTSVVAMAVMSFSIIYSPDENVGWLNFFFWLDSFPNYRNQLLVMKGSRER